MGRRLRAILTDQVHGDVDVVSATWLGVDEDRLTNWRKHDQGPIYIRVGRRTIRYEATEVKAFRTTRANRPRVSSTRRGRSRTALMDASRNDR